MLMLTDMFGGTPANLGDDFLETDRVEVITGVNLPMLIKLARLQSGQRPAGRRARDARAWAECDLGGVGFLRGETSTQSEAAAETGRAVTGTAEHDRDRHRDKSAGHACARRGAVRPRRERGSRRRSAWRATGV